MNFRPAAPDRLEPVNTSRLAAGHPFSVIDTPIELFDRILAVDVRSMFLGLKYVIPEMMKSGGGVYRNDCLNRRAARRSNDSSVCHQQACCARVDACNFERMRTVGDVATMKRISGAKSEVYWPTMGLCHQAFSVKQRHCTG